MRPRPSSLLAGALRALSRGLLPALPAALLAPACGPASGAAARPVGPNLLLVTIDTLRADHLGAYGYGRPTSPSLDRLAASSVRFADASAHASWTLPSLATLHTSLYSSTHGCWFFDSRLDDSFRTLAETLRDAGWDTGLVASHVFLGAQFGLNQGFVHFDDEMVHEMVQSDLSITSPEVAERAATFLRQEAESPDAPPWFLWAHFFDPHAEYQRQPGFSEQFGLDSDVDLYDGEIAFTDHHLGILLDALDEHGFADDTVVVLLSDHGEEFGDHGGRLHGHSLYQELVHTPLLVRAPGFAPRDVRAPVRVVDVMPTILELLGVEPDRALFGTSLVGAMRGADPDAERPVFAELRLDPRHRLDSLRRGRWKLLVDLTNGGREHLFDLEADPGEQHDVAGEHPDVVSALAAELAGQAERARAEAEHYSVGTRAELLPGEVQNLSELGYVEGADGAEDGHR